MREKIDEIKDVIMFGDSLIEWFRTVKYKNLGHAGDTTRDVLWYLEDYTSINGDIAVLLVGVNDLLCDFKSELIQKYYISIIKILKEKFKKILLIKLLPTDSVVINKKIIEFNKFIDEISVDNNEIYVLDMYSKYFDEAKNAIYDLYTTDGIHLSNAGYEEFSKNIDEKISYIREQ